MQALLARAKAESAAAWIAAGISLLLLSVSLMMHSQAAYAIGANGLAQAAGQFIRPAYFVGLIISGCLLMAINIGVRQIKMILDSLMAALFCIASLGSAFAWQQPFIDSLLMTAFCNLMLASTCAWLVASLGLLLAVRMPLRTAVVAVTVALAAEHIAFGLVTQLSPGSLQPLIAVALASIGCIMLLASARSKALPAVDTGEGEPDKAGARTGLDGSEADRRLGQAEPRPDPGKAVRRYLLAIMLLMSLCACLMLAIRSVGFWSESQFNHQAPPVYVALSAVCAAALCSGLAWLLLIRRSDLPLNRRYQAALLTVISCCLAWLLRYWLFAGLSLPAGEIATDALALFGILAMGTVAVDAIQSLRTGGYRLLGAPALLAGLLGGLWTLPFKQSEPALAAAVLAMALGTLITLVGFPSLLLDTLTPPEPASGQDEDVHAVSDKYSLTPRESEILVYLVHGRSRPYIQQKLFLSDGTIKTHTMHIYAKLGVHTRQQLLDLVEGIEAEE